MSPTNTVDVADSRTKFVFVSDADKQIFQNSLTPLLRSLFKDYFTYLHSNLESKDFIKYYNELIDTQKPGKSEKFIQTAFENNGFNWDSSILDGVTDPTYLLGRLLYSKLYKAHYRNDDGRNAALKYSIDEVYEMEDGATVTFKQQVNTLRIIRNMFHHSADTTYQDAKNPLLPNRYPHLKATLCDENDAASWVLDDTSIATCINTFNLMLNIFPGQKNSAEIREKVKTLTEKIAHLERWKVGRESAPFTTSEPVPVPTPQPTPEPVPVPTPQPTPEPVPVPTPQPTPEPVPVPTPQPTPEPVPVPTPQPTPEPVPVPTPQPTPEPVPVPIPQPTLKKEDPVIIVDPVTHKSPQYLIFLVDESGSMESKKEAVKSALNNTLMTLADTGFRGSEGEKNYFYASIIGYYGSTRGPVIHDLFNYKENTPDDVKSAEIRSLIDVRTYGIKFDRVRFEPGGTTPMKEAFEKAKELVDLWHKNADDYVKKANPNLENCTETYFPPIILSISDGRYDDSETGAQLDTTKSPSDIIEEIKNGMYSRFSGKPVIMNVHISEEKKDTTESKIDKPIAFPHDISEIDIKNPDYPYLSEMFNLSSPITDNMYAVARNHAEYADIKRGARAFLHNVPTTELQKILLIGTQRTRPSVTNRSTVPDDVGN